MFQKMVRFAGAVTETGDFSERLRQKAPLMKPITEGGGGVVSSGKETVLRVLAVEKLDRSTFVIIFLVLCMHVAVLFALLSPLSSANEVIAPFTISGVLIEIPRVNAVESSKELNNAQVPAEPPVQSRSDEPTLNVVSTPFPKKPLPSEKLITLSESSTVEEPVPEVVEMSAITDPDTAPVLSVDASKSEEIETSLPSVAPPHLDATYLNNPAPVYPRTALRLRQEGTVILNLLIRADGSVAKINIETSSGYPRLDKAALKAVKRWRYTPAQRGDEAIDFWYEQPIVFSLRK